MLLDTVKPKDRGITLRAQSRKGKKVSKRDKKKKRKVCESDSEGEFDFDMALLAKKFKMFL